MASSTTSELRIGDAERNAAVERLRGHAAAGRLTLDELDERLGQALAARTRADLAVVEHDLPRPRRPRRQDPELRAHVTAFVAVNVMLVAIWALSGGGYFWPVWPFMGWGIGVVSHALGTGYCSPRSTSSRGRAPSRTIDQLPSRS
jgi:hypothetical protein